jgi:hypothetical protein
LVLLQSLRCIEPLPEATRIARADTRAVAMRPMHRRSFRRFASAQSPYRHLICPIRFIPSALVAGADPLEALFPRRPSSAQEHRRSVTFICLYVFLHRNKILHTRPKAGRAGLNGKRRLK